MRRSIRTVNDFPYADRYTVNRTLPASGRPRADVLAEMQTMATEEDAFWAVSYTHLTLPTILLV